MSRRALTAILITVLACTPAVGQPADPKADGASATVVRLNQEKLALKAEVAKRDQKIATLIKLLEENGITVPTDDDAETAAAPAPGAKPAKGTWLVKIVTNEQPDAGDLQMKLMSARAKITDVDRQLVPVRQRYEEMQNAYEFYYNGRIRERRKAHSNAAIAKARADVSRLEGDRRRATQDIARAERGLQDVGNARIIVAQNAQGEAVELAPMNAAAGQVLRALQPGQWYDVAGTGMTESGSVSIKVTGAIKSNGPGSR
jgi:hypothetical protein